MRTDESRRCVRVAGSRKRQPASNERAASARPIVNLYERTHTLCSSSHCRRATAHSACRRRPKAPPYPVKLCACTQVYPRAPLMISDASLLPPTSELTACAPAKSRADGPAADAPLCRRRRCCCCLRWYTREAARTLARACAHISFSHTHTHTVASLRRSQELRARAISQPTSESLRRHLFCPLHARVLAHTQRAPRALTFLVLHHEFNIFDHDTA